MYFDAKDRQLLHGLGPWGATYLAAFAVLFVISARMSGAAAWGNVFYALLLLPFAWAGLASYLQSLDARRMPRTLGRALTLLYLCVVSGKILGIGYESEVSAVVILINTGVAAGTWLAFSSGLSFSDLRLSTNFQPQYRWIEDVLFLVVVVGILSVF